MPNWTAMRYRFKRSRRAQLLVGMVVVVLVFWVNSLIAEALRPETPRAPAGNATDAPPVTSGRVVVGLTAPVWRAGDHWVWEDGYGLRVKDEVMEISFAGTGENRVALYHVRRESSAMEGLDPRVENITYDSRTLSVRRVEAPGLTVDWLQRTLGLVHTSTGEGFASNGTTERRGLEGRVWRVANVTATSEARVTLPVGRFTDVTYVAGRYLDYDLRDADRSRALGWARWYSPSVGNDVAFRLPNGTVLSLVGYRYQEGDAFVPAPEPDGVPSWRRGASWTYEDAEGNRRVDRVVAAGDGYVRVAHTTEGPRGTSSDHTTYLGSLLAPVNYTLLGAYFEISPHGVPVAQAEDATFDYVKTLYAAGPPREFRGNATVDVRGAVVVETKAGRFDAVRIDVAEEEVDEQGRPGRFRTVRFYAPEVANDVRFFDGLGVEWTLVDHTFGPRPYRQDTLPPP